MKTINAPRPQFRSLSSARRACKPAASKPNPAPPCHPDMDPRMFREALRWIVAPVGREEDVWDVVHRNGGPIYRVDLVTGWCSCSDRHGNKHRPCRHMLFILRNLLIQQYAEHVKEQAPRQDDTTPRDYVREAGYRLTDPPAFPASLRADAGWCQRRERRIRRDFGDF